MWKYTITDECSCTVTRVGDSIIAHDNKIYVVHDIYIGKGINDVCTNLTHPVINGYHPNYYLMCSSCKYLNPCSTCTVL